jgi:hypothetical protein
VGTRVDTISVLAFAALLASSSAACSRKHDVAAADAGAPASDADLPVEIAAGMDNTCARTRGGAVRCWGDDARTSMTRTMADLDPPTRLTPAPVRGVRNAASIALGPKYGCAIVDGARVVCWSDESLVAEPRTFVDVAKLAYVATSRVCALVRDGTLQCAEQSAIAPAKPVSGAAGLSLAIGIDDAGCGVRRDGSAKCWGGSSLFIAPKANVSALAGVESLAGRIATYCAVAAEGKVWCWGSNSGELGRATRSVLDEDDVMTPLAIENLPAARKVSMGGWHACAIDQSGGAWCWGGDNDFGQLGDGTNAKSARPVRVHGISNAVDVACGEFHACALLGSGEVWCWGRGGRGQLGEGATSDRREPVKVRWY